MHTPRKVILDTDPGGDDAVALFWLQSLAKQGLAEIVAVTSAAGNVSAQQTFTSACQLLRLGGFPQIDVGRGVLTTAIANASHIHGGDGMGNLSTTLPPAERDYDMAPASDELLIEKLNQQPGQITVIAIGPLTNLASAEIKSPGILQKAKEIVLMGGAFYCPGNVTSQAEFNIWFNPQAAETVFKSRDDLVIVPLDITRTLVFTQPMAEKLQQIAPENFLAAFLKSLCQFMTRTALKYRETNGTEGFLIHDAAAIAYVFYPELFLLQRSAISVETQGQQTLGQTLINKRCLPTPYPNSWIALQVNQSQFFTYFMEDLRSFFTI